MFQIAFYLYLTLNIIFIFLLSANNVYSLNKKTLVVQNGLKKINLIYYDKFPYKKNYNEIKTPECIRITASKQKKTSDFLLCREYITLLRPASVIKLWQHQQRIKGYLLFSMREFGITNVHAHITGVNKYTSVIKNNITPDSIHVTGKFIRYTPEVNRYTIQDRKTSIISTVNATPNHPFYVKNRYEFIPISKILPSDSLITLSNHPVHLIHPDDNNYTYSIGSKKNTLTRVYNIEIEKKHIYFISELNILVHNPCQGLENYYYHLKNDEIIQDYFEGNKLAMRIELKRENLSALALSVDEPALNLRGRIKPELLTALHRLGFGALEGSGAATLEQAFNIDMRIGNADDILVWKLRNPISMDEYEETFLPQMPDYYDLIQHEEVHSAGRSAIENSVSSDTSAKLAKVEKRLQKAEKRHRKLITKIKELKELSRPRSSLFRTLNELLEYNEHAHEPE